MQNLSTSLGVKHRFSTVCAPWSNGIVESVCKEVLRVMHAFNSETRTPEADWSTTVQAIQSIIKNSLSRRLGGRVPITVHTGMPSGNPLTVALSGSKIRNVRSIDPARLRQKMNVDALLETLDQMHNEVDSSLSKSRKGRRSVTIRNSSGSLQADYGGLRYCQRARRDPAQRCPPNGLVPAVFRASSLTSLSSSSIFSQAPLPSFMFAASSRTPTLRLEPRRR